jgi:hypothetical protein
LQLGQPLGAPGRAASELWDEAESGALRQKGRLHCEAESRASRLHIDQDRHRSVIMRLSSPRIKSLRSEDGKALLEYVDLVIDREEGGGVYRFTYRNCDDVIEIMTRVGCNFFGKSTDKYRQETGQDLFDQGIEFIDKYVLKNSEIDGATFTVIKFDFETPEPSDNVLLAYLRDRFCELYLRYASTHRYNSEEPIMDPDGFYPDRIYFSPFEFRKFWKEFSSKDLEKH